jgi:hypothetical protein
MDLFILNQFFCNISKPKPKPKSIPSVPKPIPKSSKLQN